MYAFESQKWKDKKKKITLKILALISWYDQKEKKMRSYDKFLERKKKKTK